MVFPQHLSLLSQTLPSHPSQLIHLFSLKLPLIFHFCTPPNHLSIGDLCISLEAIGTPHEQPSTFMAAGRVLSQKFFSKMAISRILARAWSTKAPWTVEDVDRSECNTFRFIFHSKEDRKQILERGPWLVNKDVIIIKEWDPNVSLNKISFATTPIWVQFHGIPLAFMTKENMWKIGEKAGGALQVKITEQSKWKPMVRAQLSVMVNNPLFPGFYLPMNAMKPIWIQVKYERIQDLCFQCGRLGHDRESCSEEHPTTVAALDRSIVLLFGPWMKANSKLKDCFHGALVKAEKEAKRAAMANLKVKPESESLLIGDELAADALEIGPTDLNEDSVRSEITAKVAGCIANLGDDSNLVFGASFPNHE
ncbi:hypothetical protein UlMin_041071 [Ulmus minor]